MNMQTTNDYDANDTALSALMLAAMVFGGAALVVQFVQPVVA